MHHFRKSYTKKLIFNIKISKIIFAKWDGIFINSPKRKEKKIDIFVKQQKTYFL